MKKRALTVAAALALLLVVAQVSASQAGVEYQYFPDGYFDCLPEPMGPLTVIKSRESSGPSWWEPDAYWSEAGDRLFWRAATYSAVGLESGITYKIVQRSVSVEAYDLTATGDSLPWPGDWWAGGTIIRIQGFGERGPNTGHVIYDFDDHHGGRFAEEDYESHECW